MPLHIPIFCIVGVKGLTVFQLLFAALELFLAIFSGRGSRPFVLV